MSNNKKFYLNEAMLESIGELADEARQVIVNEQCERIQADAETALVASVTIRQDYPGMGEGILHTPLHKWIYILRLCAYTIADACDELETLVPEELHDWEPTEADIEHSCQILRAMGVEEE
jgi:hypothetical protein